MTRRSALALIRRHGVVLEAAKGLEPRLAEEIAGAPIRGNWWSHAKGHEIFELTQAVRDSEQVLVCTLAKGRITFVHERLWPAFVRLANRFPAGSLDQVREVHVAGGRHERRDVQFPEWVPAKTRAAAKSLSEADARAQVAVWLERYGEKSSKTVQRRRT